MDNAARGVMAWANADSGVALAGAPGNGAMPVQGMSLLTSLQQYLRVLWSPAPDIRCAGWLPHISGTGIVMPVARRVATPAAGWHWYRAAAAHAAAHLVYSPPAFDCSGLPPITRALLGVLEDARVEVLACRELPGLRRLWRPLHNATPLDGNGLEVLMLRLARRLIDPGYDDPHPWVRKGRRLFFVDASGMSLALRRPDELRMAASLLGNDIGQMRLNLNPRAYLPGPDYRDDLRWLDAANQGVRPEPDSDAEPPGSEPRAKLFGPRGHNEAVVGTPQGVDAHSGAPPSDRHTTTYRYPEWDRLIRRLRHDWCEVSEETVMPRADDPVLSQRAASYAAAAQCARLQGELMQVLLQSRSQRRGSFEPADDGEWLDVDEMIRARFTRRLQMPVDPRVYRRRVRSHDRGRVALVIDQSASTATAWGSSGLDMLQASSQVAARLAAAFQQLDIAVSVGAFNSNGRQAVKMRVVKAYDEPLRPMVFDRLAALRSGDSTRLGAAIRHAAGRLSDGPPCDERQLVIISDSLPFDIDVHDPSYLKADARHAVRQTRCRRIRVSCLVLDAAGAATARQVFGAGRFGVLDTLSALAGMLRRLAL